MKRLLTLAAIVLGIGSASLSAHAQPFDRRGYHRPHYHAYHRPIFHRPPHFVRRDDRR